jgi:hypothetical protein
LAGIRVLQRGAMSSTENSSHLLSSHGSSGRTRHHSRASWPLNDYVHRPTLALFEADPGAPPAQAWRRKLNGHANLLREFSVTFMEAFRMLRLGMRMWMYVQSERSQGRVTSSSSVPTLRIWPTEYPEFIVKQWSIVMQTNAQ